MSDEIRMTLLHHSTNDLVEELLMWRGLAAEHLDRIAELEAAQRWIPVSERLPKVYVKVIALAKDCMNVDWALPEEFREVGKGAFARLYEVTHWMPLPEPPREQVGMR